MNHPQLWGARWIVAMAAATGAAFLAFTPPAMRGANNTGGNSHNGNGNSGARGGGIAIISTFGVSGVRDAF